MPAPPPPASRDPEREREHQRRHARDQVTRAKNIRNQLYCAQIQAVQRAEQAVLAYQQAERQLLQATNALVQIDNRDPNSHQLPHALEEVDVTIDATIDNHPTTTATAAAAYVGCTQPDVPMNPNTTHAGTGTSADAHADDIDETETESDAPAPEPAPASATAIDDALRDTLGTLDAVSPAPLQNVSESRSRLTSTRPVRRSGNSSHKSAGALLTDDSPLTLPSKIRTPVAPARVLEDDSSIVPASGTGTPNGGLFFDLTPTSNSASASASAKTPLKKRKPKFLSSFVSSKKSPPQASPQVTPVVTPEVTPQTTVWETPSPARRSKRTRKQVSYNYDDPSSDILVTNPDDVHLLDWDEVKRTMPNRKNNHHKSKRLKS